MDIKKQIANIQQSAATNQRWKQDAEIEITDHALDGVDKLFKSILPHFPAWRQTCKTEEELGRLKLAWTKALIRNKVKTGKNLNLKAGILACEESDTDWLPSCGKFIKWCEQDDNCTAFAERAYKLFITGQKQIDTVGRMVTAGNSFELRQLKASECKKQFIELYLQFAENNAVEHLESHLLAEEVQLTTEQQKEAKKRAEAARNEFLGRFSCLIASKPDEKPIKQAKTGVQSVKKVTSYKSPAQLEKEKERQLKAIGRKL